VTGGWRNLIAPVAPFPHACNVVVTYFLRSALTIPAASLAHPSRTLGYFGAQPVSWRYFRFDTLYERASQAQSSPG
jgi:hypothetical protein